MTSDSVLCACVFDRCSHKGKMCSSQDAKVKLTAESKEGLQITIQICDKCWETVQKVFPVAWPSMTEEGGHGFISTSGKSGKIIR
jgi:hypothetical protein